METIMVKDYIQSAFSANDVDIIKPIIDKALDEYNQVILDFTGIKFFTYLFMTTGITCYVDILGEEKYKNSIQVQGLSGIGQATYDHSLEFAIEWNQLTGEQKEAQIKAFSEIMEDI